MAFTGEIQLGSLVNMLMGVAAIQRDLDKTKKWADQTFTQISQDKLIVLHTEQPHVSKKAGENWPDGRQFAEKALGVGSDRKLEHEAPVCACGNNH